MDTSDAISRILVEWKKEPDPAHLLNLTRQGILTDASTVATATTIPELQGILDFDVSKLRNELLSVIPYFYRIYEEASERFPDEPILFAGRDARILYVFFKTLANIRTEDTSRYIQIPGSREFYSHKDLDLTIFAPFLGKKRCIFVDTGFEGSLGIKLRKLLGKDASSMPIILVSNYSTDPSISQFKDYGKASDTVQGELNSYIKRKADLGITEYAYVSRFSRINDYVAVVMQNIPQYHGSYAKTLTIDGKPSAVSNGRGKLSKDAPTYEINPDFINPIAALMLDRALVADILARESSSKA